MDPILERVREVELNLHMLRVEISVIAATITNLVTKADLAELKGMVMVELVRRDPSSLARLLSHWTDAAKRS